MIHKYFMRKRMNLYTCCQVFSSVVFTADTCCQLIADCGQLLYSVDREFSGSNILIGEEHLDGIISQFLEICGTELYGWTLDDYSKINPAYAREIDEIEKFFVANYSEGSEKRSAKKM